MRKYVLAAMLAATVAAPAMAQVGAPFTGPRVEGIVGYDRTQVEDIDDSSDGVVYGVGAGYDFQAGNLVAGIEAEAAFSTVEDCEKGVVVPADTLCAKVGRDLYVGGRIGSQVASNTLLYAKAGYTNARLETDYTAGVVGTQANERVDLDGVRLGAGAEFALGPNSFAKAEYRYSNYEQNFEKHQVVAGFGFRF